MWTILLILLKTQISTNPDTLAPSYDPWGASKLPLSEFLIHTSPLWNNTDLRQMQNNSTIFWFQIKKKNLWQIEELPTNFFRNRNLLPVEVIDIIFNENQTIFIRDVFEPRNTVQGTPPLVNMYLLIFCGSLYTTPFLLGYLIGKMVF